MPKQMTKPVKAWAVLRHGKLVASLVFATRANAETEATSERIYHKGDPNASVIPVKVIPISKKKGNRR